jgi:prepilin-type N-terminal cleavage/methylation domain-containing protein
MSHFPLISPGQGVGLHRVPREKVPHTDNLPHSTDTFATASGRKRLKLFQTRSDTGERGFTLLELIIVMLLSTLILGLSALFFARTLPSGRLNATAREMSAMIRYARSFAQISGERQSIVLDLDAATYGIAGKGEKKLPREVTLKVIDPLSGPMQEGTVTMVFEPTGFMSAATIELSTSNRAIRLQTDPVVGSVTLR